jgi:putative membrane protein
MRNIAGWIFGSIFAVILTLVVLSFVLGWRPPVGYPPFFFFGWWVFFPLVIFGFLFFFRWWGWGWWYSGRYYHRYDPAMDALRERYARGEITKEQFEQMRQELERS